jgi:DNA gyrase/topoisomerase IV subunit A
LAKPERINQIIDDELVEIKEQYGDERRSVKSTHLAATLPMKT